MDRYISKQTQFGHLWLAEVERFEYDEDDKRTVECEAAYTGDDAKADHVPAYLRRKGEEGSGRKR